MLKGMLATLPAPKSIRASSSLPAGIRGESYGHLTSRGLERFAEGVQVELRLKWLVLWTRTVAQSLTKKSQNTPFSQQWRNTWQTNLQTNDSQCWLFAQSTPPEENISTQQSTVVQVNRMALEASQICSNEKQAADPDSFAYWWLQAYYLPASIQGNTPRAIKGGFRYS